MSMVEVNCQGCNAEYKIDERRIPASGLKMRCPKCGTSVLVQKPGAPPPPAQPAPPAPPRPGGPPRPAPPRPATPAPAIADLPAPLPSRPSGAAGPSKGFGEIDLMVDIPGGDAIAAEPTNSGEIDLPAVPGAAPPPPAGGGGFGEIDLPAALPQPGGFPPPAGAPTAPAGGFGEIDLPLVASPAAGPGPVRTSSGFNLPAQRPPGGASPGIEIDLPVSTRGAGLPMPGGVDLPSPVGSGSPGLPSPAGAGLPSPAGAGLPSPGGAGLPAVGGAGLPSPGGAGLPSPGGAGLPSPGGAGLPATGGAGFPAAAGGAGFPAAAGGAGFPAAVGGAGFPAAAGGAGFPASAGGTGFPSSAGGTGFPSSAGGTGFPEHASHGFPQSAQSSGVPSPANVLPAAAGAVVGADLYGDMPPDGASGNASGRPLPSALGGEDNPFDHGGDGGPGFDHGGDGGPGFGDPGDGADLDGMGSGLDTDGVGDEVNLEGGGAIGLEGSGEGGGLSEAPQVELAPKKSSTIRYVAVGVLLFAMGGAALTLVESVGPFGFYFVSDTLNASSHQEALDALKKGSQDLLAQDVSSSATRAFQQGLAAQQAAPRHKATAGYAAYLAYAKALRFGTAAGDEAVAAGLLDGHLKETQDVREVDLARAARDAVTGQLARARQSAAKLVAGNANDIDAAVLAGEIELAAKAPETALEAWTKAVGIQENARTLYGLARAQLASNQSAEAEKTAKKVLEASPNHVAARVLLASIAAKTASRDEEARALLQKVTDDAAVRDSASANELVEAYTQIGMLHLQRGRISDAEKAFGEALKLNPEAVNALVGNGELFFRSERFTEAEARFEGAKLADQDNVVAKVGVAKSQIMLERTKEAKDALLKLREAHPKNALVAYWLGRTEASTGDAAAAEKAYRDAISVGGDQPDVVDAYISLADLLASLGRTDEADALLLEASEKFTDLAALHKAQGEVAMRTGDYDAAVRYFDKALDQGEDLEVLFMKGSALRRARRFDEAVASLDQVAEQDKEFPGLALERGLYYEDTGQSEKALEMYRSALQKAPDDLDLKLRVGSTQVIAGHAKQAEPLLEEVLTDRPTSAEANHFLGRALLEQETNLSKAQALLDRAVQLSPNRAEFSLYSGWVATDLGQYAKAEQAIAKAMELDKNNGDVFWRRAELRLKNGQYEDALKDCETALELRPSRFEAYATMAVAHEAKNNAQAAEEAWQQAVAGNPDVALWQYRVGKLAIKRGNREQGIDHLTRSAELAEAKEPAPKWLFQAHFELGEALWASDKEVAAKHYRRYLELAPTEDVFREDVRGKLRSLDK